MSLEELKAEQEAASQLRREGGNAVHEFLAELTRIAELVGSPAGIRLRWVTHQLSRYEREGTLDRRTWHFSGMRCGAVMISDLERSAGGLNVEILRFLLSSSASSSGYEIEVPGSSEGESYKTSVERGALPLLLHGDSQGSFEYRCLWSSPSDNAKVVQAIIAWLAGEKLESEFSFYVPSSSESPNSSEKQSEISKSLWVRVGVIVYLLVGVVLAEWSDTPVGFTYLIMVLIGPVLAVLVLAAIVAFLSS